MKLKYTEILKKINQQSNKLVLEYDKDIEDILKTNPFYLKFVEDKLQLKKKIEEKYKHLYAGNIEAFNLYLESLASDLVFSKNDKNKELSQAIKKEITTFYKENYPTIKDDFLKELEKHTHIISDFLNAFNIEKNFIKADILNLEFFMGFKISLKVTLNLNDYLKEILTDKVIYDNPDNCCGFCNPEIYHDDTMLFSGITEDEFYSWY